MIRMLLNLLLAIFVWLGSCCIASAQATGDQITKDGQIIQADSSSTGIFQPVTVDPNASANVKLQFPLSMASRTVAVSALDGGVVSAGNAPTIDSQGLLVFSFQVTGQPGVHRVIVIDPTPAQDSPHIVAMVRFEVPNP